MRSCREIIRIVDQQTELSFLQRLEVRFHLIICRRCLLFAKHLRIIKKSYRRLLNSRIVKIEQLKDLEQRIIKDLKS